MKITLFSNLTDMLCYIAMYSVEYLAKNNSVVSEKEFW